jgi:glycine reductase
MSYRVVHYINNFFAGVGGEDMAHVPPEKRTGTVGPGMALQAELGAEAEIVATLVCGDNYFGEHTEEALGQLLAWVKEEKPDLLIAGPAFNAGRYGFACGSLVKAVEEKLDIPAFTAMFDENPGVDTFRRDCRILKTGQSAASMKSIVPVMSAFAKKIMSGAEISGPQEEGYFERGIRVNYFHEKRGSERAIDMLLQKIAGENPVTEYPLPVYDRVDPAPPVTDMRHTKVALVTSGGVVPQGNPDRIETSNATKYGIHSIAGKQRMSK